MTWYLIRNDTANLGAKSHWGHIAAKAVVGQLLLVGRTLDLCVGDPEVLYSKAIYELGLKVRPLVLQSVS